MDLNKYFPEWSQQIWHGMPLWSWIGIPVRFIAAYAFMFIIGRLIFAVVEFSLQKREPTKEAIQSVLPPLELLLAVEVFRAGRLILPLGPEVAPYIVKAELFLNTFSMVWLFFRLTDIVCNRADASLRKREKRGALAVILLLRRLMKGVIAILGVLFLLQNLGFNVSAMLAGLGIGGVAIALASQKTVENLFGGVMLVLDQPVRVGDFGIFDKYVGTVEDIGLRSTRIRTLDRTIVTIPNGDFSQLKLESFTARDMLLFKAIVGLVYSTPPEAMRNLIAAVNDLLGKDERILPGFHFKLIAWNSSSLDLELFSYVKTNDWDKFLVIREELMLKIMDIVRENGSDFAFPSQTTYLPEELTDKSLEVKEALITDGIKGTAPPSSA